MLAAVVLTSCSSGGAPGSGDVIEQIDEAKKVQLESDLRNVAVAEEAYFAQTESYSTDLTALGVEPSENVAITVVTADANGFCAEAAFTDAPDAKLHVVSGGTASEDGPCPSS